MRQVWLALLGPGLLALTFGCHHLHHTAGVCDCDPPPVGAVLYNYPGGTRPAVPTPGATAPPPASMLAAPPLAPMPAGPAQSIPVMPAPSGVMNR